MSDLWAYNPDVCDGDICWLDCDHCPKRDVATGVDPEKDYCMDPSDYWQGK